MDRKNQPILEELLLEALRSVTITRRGSDRIAHREHRRRVLTYRSRHNPPLLLDTFTYEPQVGGPEVREAVLDFLRSELKQFLHKDRTFTATFAILSRTASVFPDRQNASELLPNRLFETVDVCANQLS